MHDARKDSTTPAENDGISGKHKKYKHAIQTNRRYCNKHDIPIGYDKHGLCSLCNYVDYGEQKSSLKKQRRVQQRHCVPLIPQDMPLKKKSGELPQVNILDTVEKFVGDFAESKYDEIYRWNVQNTTSDKHTRAAEPPTPRETNPTHTFNTTVCEWPSLGESLVDESRDGTNLKEWVLCPRKCQIECDVGYDIDSYSITDCPDDEASWTDINPKKVMSFVEVLKKNQQKMKGPRQKKAIALFENVQGAHGCSSRDVTVTTQTSEEDILNQYYHSKLLLAKCRPRNHATKNSRKGVLSFPRYGRKQNRQRSSGRRRFG